MSASVAKQALTEALADASALDVNPMAKMSKHILAVVATDPRSVFALHRIADRVCDVLESESKQGVTVSGAVVTMALLSIARTYLEATPGISKETSKLLLLAIASSQP